MWIETTALGLSSISPLMVSGSAIATNIVVAGLPAAFGVKIAKDAITTGVGIAVVKIVK